MHHLHEGRNAQDEDPAVRDGGVLPVFLYTSPAGLVFYWTLNNIFSLIKTIFYKLKHPGRVLKILAAVAGAALLALGLVRYSFSERPVVKAALLLLGAALMLPLIVGLIRTKKPAAGKPATKPNAKIFFGCAAFLALFIGGYIPASVISSSAQEFVNVQMYYSPIWFVINSLCLAIGTFVIWFGIFYWLASQKGKVAFEKVLWMLVGVAIVDFMFFGKYLGVLSSTLSFEGGMQFAPAELWGNLLAIAATAGVMYLVYRRWSKHVFKAAIAFVLAIAIMLPINIGSIHSQIKSIRQTMEESGGVPEYTMSKTGKNVIVLMLDRAVGAFLPYIFNENRSSRRSLTASPLIRTSSPPALSRTWARPRSWVDTNTRSTRSTCAKMKSWSTSTTRRSR